MDYGSARNNKGKLIAWCVLIAAVVIIYVAMTARAHKSNIVALTPSSSAGSSQQQQPSSAAPSSSSSMGMGMHSSGNYKDGTYAATSSYETSGGVESIKVSLQVSGGTVTGADVSQTPTNRTSEMYQQMFQDNYQSYVVGKKLSDINLQRVSGSSLTSQGFDDALDQIKSQAQS